MSCFVGRPLARSPGGFGVWPRTLNDPGSVKSPGRWMTSGTCPSAAIAVMLQRNRARKKLKKVTLLFHFWIVYKQRCCVAPSKCADCVSELRYGACLAAGLGPSPGSASLASNYQCIAVGLRETKLARAEHVQGNARIRFVQVQRIQALDVVRCIARIGSDVFNRARHGACLPPAPRAGSPGCRVG